MHDGCSNQSFGAHSFKLVGFASKRVASKLQAGRENVFEVRELFPCPVFPEGGPYPRVICWSSCPGFVNCRVGSGHVQVCLPSFVGRLHNADGRRHQQRVEVIVMLHAE